MRKREKTNSRLSLSVREPSRVEVRRLPETGLGKEAELRVYSSRTSQPGSSLVAGNGGEQAVPAKLY